MLTMQYVFVLFDTNIEILPCTTSRCMCDMFIAQNKFEAKIQDIVRTLIKNALTFVHI